jgi:hypothetical protein
MQMHTFILSDESASQPIGSLLEQATSGGIEIRNAEGRTIAFVLAPDDQEAWAYAEAAIDVAGHRDEIIAAMERRSGVTTEELLAKAERAGRMHDLSKAFDAMKKLFDEKMIELGSQRTHDYQAIEQPAVRKAKAG